MKRESHILVGVLSAYALNLPVAPAMFASTLPDIDLKLGIKHRTWTHHAVLIPLLLIPAVLSQNSIFLSFAVGYVSHLIGDAFTPSGIPYWTFRDRFSINAFKTGSLTEYFFVAVFALMVLAIKGTEIKSGNWSNLLPADIEILKLIAQR